MESCHKTFVPRESFMNVLVSRRIHIVNFCITEDQRDHSYEDGSQICTSLIIVDGTQE